MTEQLKQRKILEDSVVAVNMALNELYSGNFDKALVLLNEYKVTALDELQMLDDEIELDITNMEDQFQTDQDKFVNKRGE